MVNSKSYSKQKRERLKKKSEKNKNIIYYVSCNINDHD